MAFLLDLVNETINSQGLAPQTLTQSAQGSSKDHSNGTFSCNAIVSFGTPGAGQTTATVQIEESADGSTNWSQISGMVTTFTGTAASQSVLRGLRSKQYVRANAITVAGTTPSLPIFVGIVEQKRYVNQVGGNDNYPGS